MSHAEPPTSQRPRAVIPVPLSDLVSALSAGVELLAGTASTTGASVCVTGVSMDSRAIVSGDLYVASPGARVHGAAFAADAVAAGAVGILTDAAGAAQLGDASVPVLCSKDVRGDAGRAAARVFDHSAMREIGVTGTNGKTTVSYLVRALLNALGSDTGLMGTVETVIGDRHIPSLLTTPESPVTHAALAAMADAGCRTAVMEVSSHALTLGRIKGAHFDVAGFTNLSQDHLDLHGSMDAYLRAKALLFSPEYSDRAVLCVDDDWGRQMLALAQVPTVSLRTVVEPVANAPEPDWVVSSAEQSGLGWNVTLQSAAGESISFSTSLPGRFNVSNTALAALLVLQLGYSVDQLNEAFAASQPFRLDVPGRMQVIGTAPVALVDFAHNPDGLNKAIQAAKSAQSEGGKLITVFGATGQRDVTKRPIMGQIVAAGSDLVIVTDDDPHDEDPAQIRAHVLAGTSGTGAAVEEISPRAAAIDRAVALANAQDTILVAGRGHEVFQEVKGENLALDDRAELAAALARHGFSVAADTSRNTENAPKLTPGGLRAGNQAGIES